MVFQRFYKWIYIFGEKNKWEDTNKKVVESHEKEFLPRKEIMYLLLKKKEKRCVSSLKNNWEKNISDS